MKAHSRKINVLVGFLAGLCTWSALGTTGSYTTESIPAGDYTLLSWSFQAEDLNHVFNTNDQTIQIQIYSNGTYYTSYSLGAGYDPDFTLQPGQSFFLLNWGTTNRAYTLSGSIMTNSSYQLSLSNSDWNAVGPAYLINSNVYLSCVTDLTNVNQKPYYTHASWNYQSATNDLVYQWSVQHQTWVQNAVGSDPHDVFTPYYTNSPYGTSPTVCPGKGFFIKPVSSKSWTQYPNPQCCDSTCADVLGPFSCPQ